MIGATVIRMELNQRGNVAVTIAGDEIPDETTLVIEMSVSEAKGWHVGERCLLGPVKVSL